jgi:pullulanase/glycogen debranching enzyme
MASGVADGMVLCLFDEAGAETPAPLRDYDHGVWHAFVPGIAEGQAYAYRATGPYDPARGVRCHPAKLLLDPYARAISGSVTFGPEVLTDMPSGIWLHVKGFTMRHPEIPPELRGTYAGLGHHAAIAHLLALGVTAVELLPVHEKRPGVLPAAARAHELLGLQHDRLGPTLCYRGLDNPAYYRLDDGDPRHVASRWMIPGMTARRMRRGSP